MSFKLTVSWKTSPLVAGEFNRDHLVEFGSGKQMEASAAPSHNGNEAKVNPEESLLAALASCHMLTFLAIAHLKQLPILEYSDNATAELGKTESGKVAVTRMILNPKVTFAQEANVTAETLQKIHDKAHANCFISNSLSSDISIEINS